MAVILSTLNNSLNPLCQSSWSRPMASTVASVWQCCWRTSLSFYVRTCLFQGKAQWHCVTYEGHVRTNQRPLQQHCAHYHSRTDKRTKDGIGPTLSARSVEVHPLSRFTYFYRLSWIQTVQCGRRIFPKIEPKRTASRAMFSRHHHPTRLERQRYT